MQFAKVRTWSCTAVEKPRSTLIELGNIYMYIFQTRSSLFDVISTNDNFTNERSMEVNLLDRRKVNFVSV